MTLRCDSRCNHAALRFLAYSSQIDLRISLSAAEGSAVRQRRTMFSTLLAGINPAELYGVGQTSTDVGDSSNHCRHVSAAI